jgi:Tissue inhibitor of metalloproteinase
MGGRFLQRSGESSGPKGCELMKRILVAFALVVVATAMTAPPCWACSCAPSSKKEKAQNADVIFTGRVIDKEVLGDTTDVKVRFQVGKVYKGETTKKTNVFTTNAPGLCGFNFKEGSKYTVFSYWSDGKKYVSSCTGTKAGAINPDNYGLPEGYPPKDS